MSKSAFAQRPPRLPRLQDRTHVRTLSSARASPTLSEQQRLSARPHLTVSSSIDKLERAVDLVKKDIWELWVKSKYMRELPGILTYSPAGEVLSSREVVGKLETKAKSQYPLLLTVPGKRASDLCDARSQRQAPSSSTLRFSSPSPSFPPRKSTVPHLRKIPSPRSLQSPAFSRKSSSDFQTFELLSSEKIDRLKAALNRHVRKGLITEVEKQRTAREPIELYTSLPATPRSKVSIFSKRFDEKSCTKPKSEPKWNEKCLKITKIDCPAKPK